MPIDDIRHKIKLSHSEDFYIKKLLSETKIREVMTRDVIAIHADEHFSKVPLLMHTHHIRHLPVINKTDTLVGVISQRDVFKIHSPKKLDDDSWYFDPSELDNIILADVMTKEPFSLNQDKSVGDAVVTMMKHRYGCIPIVTDSKKLKGIITQYDILEIAAAIYMEGGASQ